MSTDTLLTPDGRGTIRNVEAGSTPHHAVAVAGYPSVAPDLALSPATSHSSGWALDDVGLVRIECESDQDQPNTTQMGQGRTK